MLQQIGSLAMSMFSGWLGREQQKAQNIVLNAEAAASNVIREGKNVEAAAVSGLANWMVAENNTRRLKAAGQQRAAAVQTLMRQREVGVADSVERQLQGAEQAGAYAANAAMAGAAGASVDVVDMASRLKRQREAHYSNRFSAYQDYDTKQRLAGIMPQSIEGLDLTFNNAGIDYGQTFSRAKATQGNWLFDAAQWAVQNPGAARTLAQDTPSFFKTPSSSERIGMPTDGSTAYKL